LFDVGQDVIVIEEDCGTKEGVLLEKPKEGALGKSLGQQLMGRVIADDLMGDGVALKRNHRVLAEDVKLIDASDVKSINVRSPMTCKTVRGICQQCYGNDLTTGEMVEIGEAVGVVAAQAIGEPGTQLTMRTFHTGGVAVAGGDITSGLPRVEEVFERRKPKVPALVSHVTGSVASIEKDGAETVIMLMAEGKHGKRDLEYRSHPARSVIVKVGQTVEKGEFLTDGSANLEELYQYAGKEATQVYIIEEITRIYELQGVAISRKHLELIVRQMFSRVELVTAGDTQFSVGDVVEEFELDVANDEVKTKGGEARKSRVQLGNRHL
jgi:DNA-directed RNA polymerase subunit beta'